MSKIKKLLPAKYYELQQLLITERFKFKLAFVYAVKLLYQKLLLPKPKEQKILKDLKVGVYRERSVLSSDDQRTPEDPTRLIRLNSSDKLAKCFSQNKAPFIVVKPLVESQNILQLLDDFPQAKALWMYRNYQDVARSLFQRFKPEGKTRTGVRDLRYIVRGNEGNWRSQNISESVRSTVIKHFSEERAQGQVSVLAIAN